MEKLAAITKLTENIFSQRQMAETKKQVNINHVKHLMHTKINKYVKMKLMKQNFTSQN